jgi:hypothetical protein
MTAGDVLDEDLVTTREAAREAGVTAPTIRKWASEGRLTPAGTRGRETLYRLTDVFDAERRSSLRRRWRATRPGRRVPQGRCTVILGGVDPCDRPAIPDAPVQLCIDHLMACYVYVGDILEDELTRMKREAVAKIDAAPRRQGYVYFIGYSDRIKIGYSVNPRHRFEVFHPDDVLLVLPGEMAHERALHELFKAHRIRGEWFHRATEILDFVAERAGEDEWDREIGDLKARREVC